MSNCTNKNLIIISASPKINEPSVSDVLSSIGEEQMKSEEIKITRVKVRTSITKKQTEQAFSEMLGADALLFIFPLYFFCLPGILMRFLQDYEAYYKQNKTNTKCTKVYAVINCGFPEPQINEEALRVIESFSEKTKNEFRFGLLIGGGGMILGTKDAPFMRNTITVIKDAFKRMSTEVQNDTNDSVQNLYVTMKFPRKLYFFMGNMGWISSAKKNGLKKKDLYKTTYRS